TAEDCYEFRAKYKMQFPHSVQALFERHALEETPKSDDPAFIRARWWTILSNSALIAAAGKEAQRQGFIVEIDNTCDDWDYAKAADYLLEKIRELRQKHERVCLLYCGDVTEHVEIVGIGGCNYVIAQYDVTVNSGGH